MHPTFHPQLTLTHIQDAAQRIRGHAIRTPLLENDTLNNITGGRVLLKAECLQRTGSFKFRGAYNKIAQLSQAQLTLGVVACSSGNHAQGLARTAQLHNCNATIVMPQDAPALKISNTKRYGAKVVLYDRYTESREEIAHAIAEASGALFVPPYDDFDIMAGQGTCGLEIMQQANQRAIDLHAVLTASSGGGLTAGVATAVRSTKAQIQIHTVEPANHDDHARSFAAGERIRNECSSASICDALLAPEPGEHTFAVNKALVQTGFTVTENQIKDAVRFAFSELKLILEPGGAATLAAVINEKSLRGLNVAIVLSGGNIDPHLLSDLLTTE